MPERLSDEEAAAYLRETSLDNASVLRAAWAIRDRFEITIQYEKAPAVKDIYNVIRENVKADQNHRLDRLEDAIVALSEYSYAVDGGVRYPNRHILGRFASAIAQERAAVKDARQHETH